MHATDDQARSLTRPPRTRACACAHVVDPTHPPARPHHPRQVPACNRDYVTRPQPLTPNLHVPTRCPRAAGSTSRCSPPSCSGRPAPAAQAMGGRRRRSETLAPRRVARCVLSGAGHSEREAFPLWVHRKQRATPRHTVPFFSTSTSFPLHRILISCLWLVHVARENLLLATGHHHNTHCMTSYVVSLSVNNSHCVGGSPRSLAARALPSLTSPPLLRHALLAIVSPSS